jgi:hypothetical protein
MATSSNDHRIDIVDMIPLSSKQPYKVPCGMNTIDYLSDSKPSRSYIVQLSHKLKIYQVAIVSYYDHTKRSYSISSIINPS